MTLDMSGWVPSALSVGVEALKSRNYTSGTLVWEITRKHWGEVETGNWGLVTVKVKHS